MPSETALDLFRRVCREHGQHIVAATIGKSEALVSSILAGERLFSEKSQAAFLGAYPPHPKILARIDREMRAPVQVTDEKSWFNLRRRLAIEAITQAQSAQDSLAEAEWLILHPQYQRLRKLLVGLDLVPEFRRVFLRVPKEGPSAEIQGARKALVGLREESIARQPTLVDDTGKKSLMHARFQREVASYIRRIDRQAPLVTLVKSEPWKQASAACCAVLGNSEEIRSIVVDLLLEADANQLFARSLARELMAVRTLTFPCPQYQKDPVGFIHQVIGRDPWEGQQTISLSVVNHKFTVAVTGHKVGKTAVIAWLCWWWVSIWRDGRVAIMNFTGNQLKAQDWLEIQIAHRESGICLACRKAGVEERPCPHSQILEGTPSDSPLGGWTSDDGLRYIKGVTAKQPTAAGGYSGAHLMVVVDEFSGMSYALYQGWITGASAKSARFVGLGNPIGQEGPMWDAVNKPAVRRNFNVITISSEDAAATGIDGLADTGYLAMMAAADDRGRESPTYMARCRGLYPTAEERAIYPMALVMTAQEVTYYQSVEATGTLIVSIDPAGTTGSGDEIACAVTRGLKVLEASTARGWGYCQYVDAAVALAKRHIEYDGEQVVLAIDGDGEGAKVLTEIYNYQNSNAIPAAEKVRFLVIPVFFGAAAQRSGEYDLAGDEAHALVANWLSLGGTFPADAKLEAEMQVSQWFAVSRPRFERRVEVASATRKDGPHGYRAKLHRSPDRLDALRIMAWAAHLLELGISPEVPRLAPASEAVVPVEAGAAARQQAVAAQYSQRMARIAGAFGRRRQ